MGEHVLVTGGAGFIGSHLADELLRSGHRVRVLDSLVEQVHGQAQRPGYLDEEAELIAADVRDAEVERVAMPDATILADFMVARATGLVKGLVVHERRMRANLDRTGGLFFSEAVLLALVKTGLPRQEAYVMVQKRRARCDRGGGERWATIGALPGRFRELLGTDPEVERAARREGARRVLRSRPSPAPRRRDPRSRARTGALHMTTDLDAALRAQLARRSTQTPWHAIGGRTLPRYDGKVRDCYIDSERGERIIVVTDRLSAFDAVVGTIPFKGQVLNQLAQFWFEQTEDIAPNHMLRVPDPNVMVARECEPLPVELVMRAYLTGVTSTSIWKAYEKGDAHVLRPSRCPKA